MKDLSFFSQQIVTDKKGGFYIVRVDLGEKLLVVVWYYPLEGEKQLLECQSIIRLPLGNYHKMNGGKIYIKPSYVLDVSSEKYLNLLKHLVPEKVLTDL